MSTKPRAKDAVQSAHSSYCRLTRNTRALFMLASLFRFHRSVFVGLCAETAFRLLCLSAHIDADRRGLLHHVFALLRNDGVGGKTTFAALHRHIAA